MIRTTVLLFTVLILSACHSNSQLLLIAKEIAPEKPGELPIKAFASLPLIEQLTVSPDGKHSAFLQNTDGETVLVTQNLITNDSHILLKNNNDKSSIRHYAWVNNERLIVGIMFLEQSGHFKYAKTRLFAINRDGSNAKADLITINNTFNQRDNYSQLQDNFTVLPNDPKHVLITLDIRMLGAPDVYKLDIYTGERELVAYNPGHMRSWLYDQQGNVRIGIGVKETTIRIMQHLNAEDEWRTFAEYDAIKSKKIIPLGFGEDPDWLYLLAGHQGKTAVFKTNLKHPESQPELVYSDPKYDVSGHLIYSADQKRVIGINYAAESGKLAYWDPEAQQLQKRLDNTLPNRGNQIITSRARQHLILSSGATFAPVYYWLNEDTGQLKELIQTYPNLKPAVLAKPETVQIKTRDGLSLEGYLTRPLKSSTTPGPAIIFPHGGPWSRDVNSFNYWMQFMVNRGWTVLQLNFRGSTGFGAAFEKTGFQRWGLEMQDDITDGVNWLITGKIADPAKICIVGGSYGGYAALMGLAKTPSLYRCGVSFAPVTDLSRLVADWSDRHWLNSDLNSAMAETRVGKTWSDRSRLKETSPVNLAEQIRAPLLLVHGVEDRSVDIAHSRDMASALENARLKDFHYLELEAGDHHLSREQDRLQFFQTMDAFLKKYQ
ncbi:MAG: S9 family peptidase [Methylococcales bacterium]